jgi:hypothetical protein
VSLVAKRLTWRSKLMQRLAERPFRQVLTASGDDFPIFTFFNDEVSAWRLPCISG